MYLSNIILYSNQHYYSYSPLHHSCTQAFQLNRRIESHPNCIFPYNAPPIARFFVPRMYLAHFWVSCHTFPPAPHIGPQFQFCLLSPLSHTSLDFGFFWPCIFSIFCPYTFFLPDWRAISTCCSLWQSPQVLPNISYKYSLHLFWYQ